MLVRSLATTLALLTLSSASSLAQTWTIDPNHSNAQFAVRHMMVSTVRGEFGKLSGTVDFDGKDVSKAAVQAKIDSTSINTRVADRDTHLKSADFLEVDKFPAITFKSKRSSPAGDGRFTLVGDLTIRGVTREVTLDVEGPSSPIKDGSGNVRAGATATTKINRRDFGLTWNRVLEAGGVTVGDEVAVTIDIEMMRKLDATE